MNFHLKHSIINDAFHMVISVSQKPQLVLVFIKCGATALGQHDTETFFIHLHKAFKIQRNSEDCVGYKYNQLEKFAGWHPNQP